ncbi:UDP-N-acetylglucosamine-N-acetylmuramyl- (pentapeptide) pyrophosphoryl-undecaprenol N- acetylglucosamine transferase [Deinococcus phoenicis]|uniref:UDP-N-acetylglucosamine-N-acetylmuramyl-(Pentapeptide) pyrophosphoryl-undecaprenol N-acetylglucosamine transferase n=2 Tax=Deinococcus phoenicis TaxID=1476583 RepID=A0A016QUD6_9DEIO|nr:UDP-N-acetylglucosamine-N-acetylmuramyl- (pentapeptide) pyrophosphoryl-undecaprenol N- acetylglucosamine transferase [Deinococcus phoenicis]
MPVREQRLPRAEALARLGLRDGPLTLLIMGGSQGSLALNNAVPDILREIFGPEGRSPEGPVQVLHSTGPRWLEEVAPRVADLPWYRPVGYTDAVAAWSASDLAITRAGTGTLAEAAFHGIPLVMVPLPESAENHQFHNALSVQEAGAGRVVEQADLAGKLGGAVLECAVPGTRAAMREAACSRSPAGAAGRFADLVERHLR